MLTMGNITISYYDSEESRFQEQSELRVEVDDAYTSISFLKQNEVGKYTDWVKHSLNTVEFKKALTAIMFYYDNGIYDKWISMGVGLSISIDYSTEDDGTVDITLFIFHNDYNLYVSILDARGILLVL